MLLELPAFCPELMGQRYIKVKLVFDSQSGIVIPEKALVNKGSEKGIYCIKEEQVYFKAVKVLKSRNHEAVIDGMEVNDILVSNPEYVRD